MNRVLFIDDRREFEAEKVQPLREQIQALSEELYSSEFTGDAGIVSHPSSQADVVWLNRQEFSVQSLRDAVAKRSVESWDVIGVDINLFAKAHPNESELEIPTDLLSIFRSSNKTAIAILYSGAISDYLRRLIDFNTRKQAKPVEQSVRRLFDLHISNFVGSDQIINTVINALQRPPLPLRIEKQLLATPKISVDPGHVSDALSMSFEDIAAEIRKGSQLGSRALDTIAKNGISAIANIFS